MTAALVPYGTVDPTAYTTGRLAARQFALERDFEEVGPSPALARFSRIVNPQQEAEADYLELHRHLSVRSQCNGGNKVSTLDYSLTRDSHSSLLSLSDANNHLNNVTFARYCEVRFGSTHCCCAIPSFHILIVSLTIRLLQAGRLAYMRSLASSVGPAVAKDILGSGKGTGMILAGVSIAYEVSSVPSSGPNCCRRAESSSLFKRTATGLRP